MPSSHNQVHDVQSKRTGCSSTLMHLVLAGLTVAVATTLALNLCSSAAWAETIAQSLPPEPPQTAPANISTGQSAGVSAAPRPSAPPTGTSNSAAASATRPLAGQPTENQVSPGPLEPERRRLLETIMTAKQYGFGITAYLSAFQSLDDRVKASAPASEIKGRLDSIVGGLDEQLKRSKMLKTQRPAPPIAASSQSPSAMEDSGKTGGLNLSGASTDELINKVKEKWFGGQIPDSIKKKIPAGFDPNSLNSETAKELLKKYGK